MPLWFFCGFAWLLIKPWTKTWTLLYYLQNTSLDYHWKTEAGCWTVHRSHGLRRDDRGRHGAFAHAVCRMPFLSFYKWSFTRTTVVCYPWIQRQACSGDQYGARYRCSSFLLRRRRRLPLTVSDAGWEWCQGADLRVCCLAVLPEMRVCV